MRVKSGFSLMVWVALGPLGAATANADSVQLQSVRAQVDSQATTFLLRLPKPVTYTPSQIGPRLFILDLAGVSTDRSAESQPLSSPLVTSYRLLQYQGADDKPHLALEITLKEDAEIKPAQVAGGLEVTVRKLAPKPAVSPAALKPPSSPATPKPPVVPAASPAPARPPAEASLQEVSVVQPDGSTGLEVEIVASGPMTYKTLELSNPPRLVVDLPNTVNRIRQKQLTINTPPLRTVRIAQFSQRPPVARVVLDLDSKTRFQVRKESNMVIIALAEAGTPQAGGNAVQPAAPAYELASAQTAEGTEGTAGTEGTESAALALDVTPEEPVLMASSQPSAMPAPPPASPSVPSAVAAAYEATSSAAPPTVTGIVPAEIPEPVPNAAKQAPGLSPGNAPAPSEPPSPLRSPAPQPLAPFQIAQAQTPPTTFRAAQPPPVQYTGEPISVDLKDVDLKDFFRLMHEISGLNIVLDPNVSGTLTIVLDEVPWDQAMDIVLKNNGLGKEVIGNVVRVARLSTLEAEERQRRALDLAVEQGQPRDTVTRTLSYAKAAELLATLKRFLSPRGELVADARTNMLIITDIPGVIPQLDALIGTLDRKSQQVEIEARVVAASRSFARDIGIQLAASARSGNIILGGTGAVGESPIKRATVPPLFIGSPASGEGFANVAQPLATNFPAAALNSGLSFVLTSGANFALDAIITAGENKGIGKLLSRPKVITQNNVEATVKQGVRIPIQTNVNNTVSVQFVDVVLRLTVTPQITAEGTIFLQTDVENTTIDPGIARIQGIPALDTQQATTQVLVSDGGTVFFGGVIQTTNNFTEEQTPLLGSIPLIGNLFKRRATTSTTNELLFFITPKIVQS